MANTKLGAAPPDGATPVGKFRLLSGDSEYTELDPPVAGMGLYALWSDAEIQAFIDVAGGSVARAISLAYAQIGASWASTGATIKTDDLSYSVKDSVGNWMGLSKYWADIADQEDDRAMDDYFELVEVRGDAQWRKAEAAPWPWCGPAGSYRW